MSARKCRTTCGLRSRPSGRMAAAAGAATEGGDAMHRRIMK